MMKIIDRKFLNVTTPSCHAGTIAIFNNKPVYAWFGGSREGAPDVSVYVQYDDKIIVFKYGNIAHWNPILFVCEDNLFLSFKIGKFCDSWANFITNISDIFQSNFDPNKTKYQIIPAGLNFCTKTKPIVQWDHVNGCNTIFCGSSVETIVDWSAYIEIYQIKNGIFEFKYRSRPLTAPKKTYQDPYYGKRQTMGIIQPSIWSSNDYFHAFFRSSRGLGKIYYSCSGGSDYYNLGWSDPVPTRFDNPNSGIDIVLIDNRLFLAHNPSDIYRYPLVISELDEELNIIDEIVVQDKTEGTTITTELSYPYLISDNKNIYCGYTYGRSKIEVVTVSIN